MAAPLQHQTWHRPPVTLADVQATLMRVEALVLAMAHQVAQDGADVPPLRQVLRELDPGPVMVMPDPAR